MKRHFQIQKGEEILISTLEKKNICTVGEKACSGQLSKIKRNHLQECAVH